MSETPPSKPPTPLLVVEAALLCAGRPLSLSDLTALFDGELDDGEVQAVVHELGQQWTAENRGFELAGDDAAWRVRSRPEMAAQLQRMEPEGRHRYSSAVLETLAVIAYLQPVTRTIIEEHRQRAVTPGVLQQLLDRGWIEVIGHQESPGRPALYATTFKFLDDLGLVSIADLPPLDDLGSEQPPAPEGPDPDDPWEGEDPHIGAAEAASPELASTPPSESSAPLTPPQAEPDNDALAAPGGAEPVSPQELTASGQQNPVEPEAAMQDDAQALQPSELTPGAEPDRTS